MNKLTHFDASGQAHMVNVGDKPSTHRIAIATGKITMLPETFKMVEAGSHKKGDVLGIARIAGIQASKKTADLIPLCHPLTLTHVSLEFGLEKKTNGITSDTYMDAIDLKGENLKILIVEDDEISDLLLSIWLKEISREILHAKNGLEAIEICRNNPDIDLLLMDIRMPVMGGYEAAKQIRQFNKNIIIIAQTAHAFEGDNENEIAKIKACNNPEYQLEIGKVVVRVDPQYYRPTEVDLLIGDPTKSKTQLGWVPQYDLAGLVKEMVASDVLIFEKDLFLKSSGFDVKNEFE